MNDITSALIYEAQLCTLAYLQHHFSLHSFPFHFSSVIKQQQSLFSILCEKNVLPLLNIPFVGNLAFFLFFAVFQTVP